MSIISLLKVEQNVKEQPREINKLLRRLLLPFGGGDFFFSGEETPLFLVDLTLPAENETGANFDVRIAYALIAQAKDHGAKRIKLAVRTEDGFDFQTVLRNSSYDKLAALEGVELIDLRHAPVVERSTDTALMLDHAPLYKPVAEADMIISLAKFKSAEGKLFGGALNNIDYSVELSADYSFEQKQRALVDVYSVLAPDLTVVDGLVGVSHFQPHQTDFVMAATDAVALDAALAAIAGIELKSVDYLQLAAQYGLGVGEPSEIHLYGDDMGELMV